MDIGNVQSSLTHYLARMPEQERVIIENGPSSESYVDTRMVQTRTISKHLKVATTVLTTLSAFLAISNIVLVAAKALKSCVLTRMISLSNAEWLKLPDRINTQREWFKVPGGYGSRRIPLPNPAGKEYTNIFDKAFPFMSATPLLTLTGIITLVTIASYALQYFLDRRIKNEEKKAEAVVDFLQNETSFGKIADRIQKENLCVDSIVKHRLLPKGTTTKEYAVFQMVMKDRNSKTSAQLTETYHKLLSVDQMLQFLKEDYTVEELATKIQNDPLTEDDIVKILLIPEVTERPNYHSFREYMVAYEMGITPRKNIQLTDHLHRMRSEEASA